MQQFNQAIWQWILAHPTAASLFAYHFGAAFIGALEMPSNQSGWVYRFFFKLVNGLAANYARAQASTTIAGYKDPKEAMIPGPEVTPPTKEKP
jgi:hypothetical protein